MTPEESKKLLKEWRYNWSEEQCDPDNVDALIEAARIVERERCAEAVDAASSATVDQHIDEAQEKECKICANFCCACELCDCCTRINIKELRQKILSHNQK